MNSDLDFSYDESLGSEADFVIHKPEDFAGMRKAGRLAAEVLDYITDYVKPGVTTEALNTLCHEFIVSHNAVPAPLNYKGFPKSICTSINNVVCHGIPEDRELIDGDIMNIDVTVILDGWYGDTSRMYGVGEKIPVKAKLLMDATYESLMKAIEIVKPGLPLNDIGRMIESVVHPKRFSVVRDFCGHGIGRTFHTAPSVLHYFVNAKNPPVLKSGMFFTIEPMINAGGWETKMCPIKKDGWTAVTKDRSLSAQFEHTIGVTETGYEIFTLSSRGYTKPPYG